MESKGKNVGKAVVQQSKRKNTKDHQKLGEILCQAGWIKPNTLKKALTIQNKLNSVCLLGELLVAMVAVEPKVLIEIFDEQGIRRRLGECLITQGALTFDKLFEALKNQKEYQSAKRTGEILVNSGLVSERQLAQGLAEQYGYPFLEPDVSMIDPNLVERASVKYLRSNLMVPFRRNEKEVVVIIHDPTDNNALIEISKVFNEKVTFALGIREVILNALKRVEEIKTGEPLTPITYESDDVLTHKVSIKRGRVINLMNFILQSAVEEGASDIHIEPLPGKGRVRLRIDGVLVHKTDILPEYLKRIITRIKVLSKIDIAEKRKHQEGRIVAQVGDRKVDLRVADMVTVHGETITIRLLYQRMSLMSLRNLGMSQHNYLRYKDDALDTPSGVVIISGPTGSGKTTTLYGSLDYLNKPTQKIITVEDPVEREIDGIAQCSVENKLARTFESSLKAVVRGDPDVVALGEIRDNLSARTAINAALIGHKVLTSLHSEDSVGVIHRLLGLDIDPYVIASTLASVVAQRLVRTICHRCSISYKPTRQELMKFGLELDDFKGATFRKGKGCSACMHTGYRGRTGVFEILAVDEQIRDAVLRKATLQELRSFARQDKLFVPMVEDAIVKVSNGVTTFDEVLRVIPITNKPRPLNYIQTLMT